MALHRDGKRAEARKTLAEAVLSHDWRGAPDQGGSQVSTATELFGEFAIPNQKLL
jgi:hypothetical protein